MGFLYQRWTISVYSLAFVQNRGKQSSSDSVQISFNAQPNHSVNYSLVF